MKNPADGEILRELKRAGDKIGEDVGSGNGIDTPNFTHSEFARLILIMKDDERAKEALFVLTQQLQRAALDSGMSRESYWGIITDRFNDPAVTVRFNFVGHIDGVNLSDSPLCIRSGTVLKDQYHKSPRVYASYVEVEGVGVGTPNEHQLLLESSAKAILNGGCEGGIPDSKGKEKGEDENEKTKASRRRRKGSSGIFDEMEGVTKSVQQIGSLVESYFKNGGLGTSATPKGKRSIREKEKDIFKYVEETYDSLERAKQRGEPRILHFAELRQEQAMREYELLTARK